MRPTHEVLPIPAQPGRRLLFGAPDGRLSIATFHDPWSPEDTAKRLAEDGWRMWIFECEEVRPVAGSLSFRLFLQGSFGSPVGTAAECVAAMNAAQHVLRFALEG